MKTKKLAPRNAAPVKRSNVATVSTDHHNAIAPALNKDNPGSWNPFAGDEAE